MFDRLKIFFDIEGDAENSGGEFDVNDLQLAEAALLFHVLQADGVVVEAERACMKTVLTEEYELTDAQVEELFVAAERAENDAVDLYRFTSLLKDSLEQEKLVQIVEHLWEMVYADGKLHELEDNVVWRIAELLNVQSNERMELKRRVRDRYGI